MKTIFYIIVYLCGVVLLGSCYEKIGDITFENNDLPIVINALITNKPGPYFVQVSKASNKQAIDEQPEGNPFKVHSPYNPIIDATVMLSDDQGSQEVLRPYNTVHPFDKDKSFSQYGFYQTSGKIQGTPGRTYTLTVQYEGKSYKATATLPLLGPALSANPDSDCFPLLSFDQSLNAHDDYIFFYDLGQGDQKNVPLEYPYVSKLHENIWTLFTDKRIVVDGQHLPSIVKDWNVYKLQETNTSFCFYDKVWIEMHRVSKQTYEYYQALIAQEINTGLFNTPSATPPTNFSNGALGFFRTSSVQKLVVSLPK